MKGEPSRPVSHGAEHAPGLSSCFAWIGVFWIALLAGELFLDTAGNSPAVVGATLLTVSAAVLLFGKPLFRAITSLPFAVALLTCLLVSTVLGTFILQGAPEAELAHQYGPAAAKGLIVLGLDDLFHSLWFNGLLALLAASLILVPFKNRAWRPPFWGHLLSHLGVVVILFGGLLGNVTGFKGFLDLRVGKQVASVPLDRQGRPLAQPESLGFALRLEDFQIEKHPPEFRLYVYRKEGEGFRAIRSFAPAEAKDWSGLGAGSARFRVLGIFPDFQARAELRVKPPGQGQPMLQIGSEEEGKKLAWILLADGSERSVAIPSPDGPAIRFLWDPPDAASIETMANRSPETHTVLLDFEGTREEVAIVPGEERLVLSGKYKLKVLEFFPDFVYDASTKRPSTRSSAPNNPALRVAVTKANPGIAEERWLFAKMPDFESEHGASGEGPRLTYRYAPARIPAVVELLVLGKTKEVWSLERGHVLSKIPLPPSGAPLPGTAVSVLRVLESAEEAMVADTLSQEWKNPVVEIEVEESGSSRTQLLAASHSSPIRLADGETFLVFEPKPEDVKAYRSVLSVREGDRRVLQKTVEVNDPLVYGGYYFYQSSFRKEDPQYSGILVVKDPGLPFAFAGFAMIAVGAIYAFYVRPKLAKRIPTHA